MLEKINLASVNKYDIVFVFGESEIFSDKVKNADEIKKYMQHEYIEAHNIFVDLANFNLLDEFNTKYKSLYENTEWFNEKTYDNLIRLYFEERVAKLLNLTTEQTGMEYHFDPDGLALVGYFLGIPDASITVYMKERDENGKHDQG